MDGEIMLGLTAPGVGDARFWTAIAALGVELVLLVVAAVGAGDQNVEPNVLAAAPECLCQCL